MTVQAHALHFIGILRSNQEVVLFHQSGVMAADVHRNAQSFVEVGQCHSAVPAVQVQLVVETQLGRLKSQIRVASPNFGGNGQLLLGARNGSASDKQGREDRSFL